jgi:hypothetical protein
MKIDRAIFAVLAVLTLAGCGLEQHKTTLFVPGRFPEDTGVETPRAILTSNRFWEKYVFPAFPGSRKEAEEIQPTVKFTLTGRTVRGVFEAELSLRSSSQKQGEAVSDILIGGFNRYCADNGGQGDYLLRKPNQQPPPETRP